MVDPVPQGYISLDESVGPLTADISDQELQRLVPGLQAQQDPELPPYVVLLPGPERVGLVSGVDAPVVDPFQHGRMNHDGADLSMEANRAILLPTKRDLALTQLYIAPRDGELVSWQKKCDRVDHEGHARGR